MTGATHRLAPVFAHQYGWDEILLFLVPVVLAVAGVRYAEKRAANRRRAEAPVDDLTDPEPEQPAP
jgi:hypothetical protein